MKASIKRAIGKLNKRSQVILKVHIILIMEKENFEINFFKCKTIIETPTKDKKPKILY